MVGLTAACGSAQDLAGSTTKSHSTSIVFNRRIGPVSFGERRAQVTRTLGRGIAEQLQDPHVYPVRYYPQADIYVAYTQPPAVIVDYHHPPKVEPPAADLILTRSTQYRINGVGVGSSLRQLQRRVAVVCFEPLRNVATGPSFKITAHTIPTECQHGPTAKAPVTEFWIDTRTKTVSEVEIVTGLCSVAPATNMLAVCQGG